MGGMVVVSVARWRRSMFESLFEFFFKYRPLVFGEGDLAFRPTTATYVARSTGPY